MLDTPAANNPVRTIQLNPVDLSRTEIPLPISNIKSVGVTQNLSEDLLPSIPAPPEELNSLSPPLTINLTDRSKELGILIDQQLELSQPGLLKTTFLTLARTWKQSPLWTTLFAGTWLAESANQVATPLIIANLAALSNKANSSQVVLFTMGALLLNWLAQSIVSDLRPWFGDRFLRTVNTWIERQFFTDLATRSNATLEHPTFSAIAVSLKDNLNKVSAFAERTFSISSSALICSLSAIALATIAPKVALGLIIIGGLQLWNGLKSAERFSEIEDQLGGERRKFWIDRVYAMTASYIIDFRAFGKNTSAIQRVEDSRKVINDAQLNDVRKRALGAFSISLVSTVLVKGYLIYSALEPALTGVAVDLGIAVKAVFMAATFELGLFNLLRRFTDQVKDSTFARKALVIGKLGLADRDPNKAYKPISGTKTPEIKFSNVHLFSDDGLPILRGIDLSLVPGKTYGICGASGAGKTSLISLLRLEHTPTAGKLLINGEDISDLDPDDVRQRIGFLTQHYTNLSSYTVREAITLGSQTRAPLSFEETCRIANIDFLGDHLEDSNCYLGLDFPNSMRFSGGQLQKIALARTLSHNADIIILDEPTSALGTEDEEKIFPALISWAQKSGKTLIIISHKFANLSICQEIIYLKDGTILEQGSHEELLSKEGEYAKRYRLEASQYSGSKSKAIQSN